MTREVENVRKLEDFIIGSMGGLPALGGDTLDARLVFTEAELNTIAFSISFTKSLLTESKSPRLLPHYGKGLESVIKKMQGRE